MPTLLDLIIDRIQTGRPVTVYIREPPCDFPDYAATTAYNWGCRCPRCRTAHNTHNTTNRHYARRLALIAARQRHPSNRR